MGAAVIEQSGDAATLVGQVRRVPGRVRERILRTAPDLIEYTVASGPFPVHAHLGRVRFEPAEPGTVRVRWACYYTPYFGLGWMVTRLIHSAFGKMLATLKAKTSAEATARESSSE